MTLTDTTPRRLPSPTPASVRRAVRRQPGSATRTDHATPAEIAAILRLLERMGANTIALGSARDAASLATRTAVARAWAARAGLVLTEVDWPESAASWLRQAHRLTTPVPDAWVMCARPDGWSGVAGRLADPGTNWTPDRTIVTASLTGPDALAAGGPATFAGLRGITRDGRTWQIGRSDD